MKMFFAVFGGCLAAILASWAIFSQYTAWSEQRRQEAQAEILIAQIEAMCIPEADPMVRKAISNSLDLIREALPERYPAVFNQMFVRGCFDTYSGLKVLWRNQANEKRRLEAARQRREKEAAHKRLVEACLGRSGKGIEKGVLIIRSIPDGALGEVEGWYRGPVPVTLHPTPGPLPVRRSGAGQWM